MRGTFDANDVTMIRPFARAKMLENASPTMRSESVCPGRSALVESDSITMTPSSPTRAMEAKSAGSPSIGVWSNLKSPVWKTVPTGVRIASAHAPASEWLMWMNCASIVPYATLSPGSTSRAFHSPGLCSLSFALISASESGVPTTGTFGNSRRTPAQRVRCPAEVVFVAVRDEQRAELVLALAQVREVVDDDVDPEHLLVGEHQAAVADDEVVVGFDDRHVGADLAAAAERNDAQVGLARWSRDDESVGIQAGS